jgi:hypothetical protein
VDRVDHRQIDCAVRPEDDRHAANQILKNAQCVGATEYERVVRLGLHIHAHDLEARLLVAAGAAAGAAEEVY